jgi:hypothetical protein
MGTTLTQLQAGEPMQVAFVVAISGYEYLLCDWHDTAAVVTAWAGTGWTQALAGCTVHGDLEQEFEPWNADPEPMKLRLVVMNADGADQFGKDVAAKAKGNQTFATEGLDAATTSNLEVKSTGAFAAAGDLFFNNERIGYASVIAQAFQTLTRGKLAPFKADTEANQRFGRDHILPSVDWDTNLPVRVTDAPREWIGRDVEVRMHRVVGGVLDVRAQAQRIFAGTITDIMDSETGATIVNLVDYRQRISDAVLLRDQFRGKLREGISLAPNTHIKARAYRFDVATTQTATLNIKTGASGNRELEPGYYTAAELASKINVWLAYEMDAGGGNTLSGSWAVGIKTDPTDNGSRFTFWQKPDDGGTWLCSLEAAGWVWQSLGFDMEHTFYRKIELSAHSGEAEIQSARAPYRWRAFPGTFTTLELEGTRGTWVDNTEWLPSPWKQQVDSTANFGFLRIGGALYLCKHSSDTLFSEFVGLDVNLQKTFGTSYAEQVDIYGATIDEDTPPLDVHQVVILEGTLTDVVTRLLATTGPGAYNHATYDEVGWGAQLGVPVPWELLGDDWVNSIEGMAMASRPIVVRLTKPTRLMDVLEPELLLRGANIVWKNGVYIVAAPQSLSSAHAVHTFDETSKGTPPGSDDADRAPAVSTYEHIRNIVKIEYNPDLDGNFADVIELRHQESIDTHGPRAVTIKAGNSFGGSASDTIAGLAGEFLAAILPFFAKPLDIVRRTLMPKLWENVAPGDLGTLTDKHVRDAVTGSRLVTGKPCMVWGHSKNFARGDDEQLRGEVALVVNPQDNVYPYAPSFEIDTTYSVAPFTNGYDAAGVRIKLKQYAYGRSGSTSKDVTHFDVGDLLLIEEIDPTLPNSGLNWNRTISAKDEANDILTLSSVLTGYVGTNLYRGVSRQYTVAQTSQRSHAYQADDADALVEDVRQPFEYGVLAPGGVYDRAAGTELPERHSSAWWGDGKPLATGYDRAAAVFLNNFVQYKSAPVGGHMFTTLMSASGANWIYKYSKPKFFGPGRLTGGDKRYLSVAPFMRSTGAGNLVYCRVTLSRFLPRTDDTVSGAVVFIGPYRQVTFSSSSTTWAVLAAQNIEAVFNTWTGIGFLSVELKGLGSHGSSVEFRGLPKEILGAVG